MAELNLKRYTIAALMDNEAGVLSQIAHLFSRKGYNIETIAAGWTEDPQVTRLTIEIISDDARVKLLCNQLRKLVPIRSVKLLNDNAVRRELVLIKVKAENRDIRGEIIQIGNIFRASIIDITPETITLSLIGDETKTAAFEDLLKEFKIIELARTGIVAIERGTDTILN
ncbi:MAG: acetolactate synthase small subunit [Synergistaceae bacterium]|nr:acetolactate synthase small subunit [Synergistaceae bacterium]MBR1602744.1 acetolactate synthase small subunit [Synergistaceae bacterium]